MNAPKQTSAERAYVSLLMISDNYLPGALTTAFGLRRQGVEASLVCLVTEDVTPRARSTLAGLYDHVVVVPEVNPDPVSRGRRQALPRMFTRFSALRLGPDGDLGHGFERVAIVDADLLPVRDFDALWNLSAPAGIINERRSHMVALDDDGRIRYPTPDRPLAAWEEVYGDRFPHGAPIAPELTDRVAEDATNYGINGSLYLFDTSADAYRELMSWLASPRIQELVQNRWPWPDMQGATLFWSGRWTSIDFSYSTLYGYPSLERARGLHFAGVKPWAWRRRGFERRIGHYPDYALWARTYLELLSRHPELERLERLRVLEDRTRAALRTASSSAKRTPTVRHG